MVLLAVLALSACAVAAPDSTLQAVLAVRLPDGVRDVPAKLVTEVVGHLQRTIRDMQVLSTTRGIGRFVMVVAFPQDDRLKFEKMIVELPTATFSTPVRVESWNINHRTESTGPTDETTGVGPVNFKLDFDSRGAIGAVRLREIPLKDVLAFLARTARIQYVCPADLGERAVSADLRSVSLDDFLKALKSALGVEIHRQGTIYIFCPPGTARPRKPNEE